MKIFEYRTEILVECEYRVCWPQGQYPQYAPLDDLGRDGWELVTIIEDGEDLIGYFKREKPH